MHSPVIQAPFEGIEAATELWGVLFATLRDFEITRESNDGDSHAFFWRAAAGRRTIEGAALVELDGQGRIREISVLIRPLANLAAFAEVVGPALAAQRGQAEASVFRVLTLPLRPLFAAVDLLAPRLIQRRR